MSRIAATIFSAALVLASSVVGQSPGHASAQAGRAEASDPRARAMPIFNEGLELVSQQRWAEALDRFLEARTIFESWTIVFNIGYCQRALGRYVDALETFQGFLSAELDGVAATRAPEARNYVRELEARLVHLAVEVPEDARRGLEVSIDGRAVELPSSGRIALRLDPGAHTVQARRDGYQPLFLDRQLRPGARERVEVALEPLPARLQVTANIDEADVILDGDSIGSVPFDAEIRPGRHRLEVRGPDYVPHRAVLNVESGDTARVRAYLSEAPAPITTKWWFWTGIVAAVAGAAVATWALTRPEPEPPPYDGGNLDWVVGGP